MKAIKKINENMTATGGTIASYLPPTIAASAIAERSGLYDDLLPSVFYTNREPDEPEPKKRKPKSKKAKDLSKFKNSKREINF